MKMCAHVNKIKIVDKQDNGALYLMDVGNISEAYRYTVE